ncbi:MAG TPA: ABC transporter permease, partial [Bacteroidales bacterium]|nr:ABC transporter permease [Bacteroidales bacterium]
MIRKIIHLHYKKFQIFGAGAGTLIGLLLLLGGGQFYVDMGHVMKENRDLIDPEYIVINKRVSFLETFNLSTATFSPSEIKEIREQPFADKVVGFISNQFALSAFTESNRFPDFYTDLFFEAVPDEYLDVKNPAWKWTPGDKTIPIILPQDYLNLYNFGFAPSQGLPQISPRTISLVNFSIEISGRGKSERYKGKIIGFSNRINSILVPYKFLSWANREYGQASKPEISRLVIVTKDPTDPRIVSFLDKKGYETIREKLKSSRLNIILKFLISFVGSLGFLIVFLAFLVFILSFQLLMTRSRDQIRKLKWLGYNYREISQPFIFDLGMIMVGL